MFGLIERLGGSIDLGQDVGSFCRPDVRAGLTVMSNQELFDGLDQLGHAGKGSTTDLLFG